MTPAARVKACIDLSDKISGTVRIPMDKVVGDYMRIHRYIGSKDRAEIAERIYNMVRAQARLGWWLTRLKLDDNKRNRILIWLVLGETVSLAQVARLFDGSKYGPEKLTESEKKVLGQIEKETFDHSDMPVCVRVECPPDYEASLKAYFGDDFEMEMAAMIPSATLDLRVNIWRSDKEKIIEALSKDKVDVDECQYSPWALRAKNKAYLSKTKAFNKGWIEIQDEGSQLIALATGAKPGMQVLDYCAGGGGKTLALAAMMRNKGRIVAMDIDSARLEKGKRRYKKAGVADIIEVRGLDDEKHRKWLRRQKESFDVVLTDVPCSGTGTWRRNPDMRWSNYGPSLDELIQVQADILDKASKTVKPGGCLVYATCSLLPEENETQIEEFLKRDDRFEVAKMPDIIPTKGGFMRLTPHRNGTDGFFAAVLQRRIS